MKNLRGFGILLDVFYLSANDDAFEINDWPIHETSILSKWAGEPLPVQLIQLLHILEGVTHPVLEILCVPNMRRVPEFILIQLLINDSVLTLFDVFQSLGVARVKPHDSKPC